jgi:hypothetical protein
VKCQFSEMPLYVSCRVRRCPCRVAWLHNVCVCVCLPAWCPNVCLVVCVLEPAWCPNACLVSQCLSGERAMSVCGRTVGLRHRFQVVKSRNSFRVRVRAPRSLQTCRARFVVQESFVIVVFQPRSSILDLFRDTFWYAEFPNRGKPTFDFSPLRPHNLCLN